MNPSNFDDLTKALASSTSRRQALRTILAASVGGLLGIGGISTAFGRHHRRSAKPTKPSGPPPGNSNCAKFCAAVYGPNTPAASACTSDGARNKGLCRDCGTKAPSSICCHRNGSGYCDGTAGACCSAGCPGCPSGKTCTGTGCCDSASACGAICCPGTAPTCCGNNCTDTQNDSNNCGACGQVCAPGETCVSGACTCGSHGDCPSGKHCCSGACSECCVDNDCGPFSFCCGGQCCDPSVSSCCGGVCCDFSVATCVNDVCVFAP